METMNLTLESHSMESFDPDTGSPYIKIGATTGGDVSIHRTIIQPDYDPLPRGIIIQSATLKLTVYSNTTMNARTLRVHRVKPQISKTPTWNKRTTLASWTAGGCSDSSSDYEGAVEIGSVNIPNNLHHPDVVSVSLSPVEIQKFYKNIYTFDNMILFVDTQVEDYYQYCDNTFPDPLDHSVLTVEYPLSSKFFMHLKNRR